MKTLDELYNFVSWAHRDQKWAGEPYDRHLRDVQRVLDHNGVVALHMHEAALMHDLFEDTPITPAMMRAFGATGLAVTIAEAVTDEPGATRKERKEKTYPKIVALESAVVLKLADRISNLGQTLRQGRGDRHWAMYIGEHASFTAALERKDHVVAAGFWSVYKNIIQLMK